jgi:hypothetical protein
VGLKRRGCEGKHSPPLVPRLRMHGAISPPPPHVFMARYLLTHRSSLLSPFTYRKEQSNVFVKDYTSVFVVAQFTL